MEPAPPKAVAHHDTEAMLGYVLPVLFALSLMHCRNVEIRTVEPDPEASRAHRRRHHHRLVRYQVLDIEPMRRILDKAGATDPSAGGLRRALTICRGHFKTFTPDAPLFGRHTGQYWWAPHVRGNPNAGIIVNDYRVHAPGQVGGAYRQASQTAPDEHLPAPAAGDPDASGAGWVEHNTTQNQIARIVAARGWAPRSPRGEEPRYDLAWARGQTIWVAEVKSVTSQNEERQLRTAIGPGAAVPPEAHRGRSRRAGGHRHQPPAVRPQLGRAMPARRDHPGLAGHRRRTARPARVPAPGLSGSERTGIRRPLPSAPGPAARRRMTGWPLGAVRPPQTRPRIRAGPHALTADAVSQH